MQKWEYLGLWNRLGGEWQTADRKPVINELKHLSREQMLERMGGWGWELVSVFAEGGCHFYFKRPKQ